MIKLDDVSFSYTSHNKLFNHLSLRLEQNGICGLLGKNGSGKTTLLKLLAGLIFADEGDIQVMGRSPKMRNPHFLGDLYFLPEDLYVPVLTGEQYIKFYAPFYPQFDHTLMQKSLVEFDLSPKQLLTKFSYGQKKKFLIAFGLATNCSLLIMDEPTNGLDIPSKTQFRKLVASIISDEKLYIISTHQVHDVEKLIDTIVILNDGKIIYQQPIIEQESRIDLENLFNNVVTQPVQASQYV